MNGLDVDIQSMGYIQIMFHSTMFHSCGSWIGLGVGVMSVLSESGVKLMAVLEVEDFPIIFETDHVSNPGLIIDLFIDEVLFCNTVGQF